MKHSAHERAIELSAAVLVEELSSAEQHWLDGHLAHCQQCAEEVAAREEMVAGLRSNTVLAGDSLVLSTQLKVRERCVEMRLRETRMRPVWISCVLASAWAIFSAPYMWQAFDSIGHWLHIPDLLWQMGFLVTWFTPAMTGAAVAFWLRPQLAPKPEERLAA